MYNYNNLMSIDFQDNQLKFNSLIVFKYFCKISKSKEFHEKIKKINKKIKILFRKYYLENNIKHIEDGAIIIKHLELFEKLISDNLEKDIQDLYEFFINYETLTNNHKDINLIYDEFKNEFITVIFMKINNIRKKFFVD